MRSALVWAVLVLVGCGGSGSGDSPTAPPQKTPSPPPAAVNVVIVSAIAAPDKFDLHSDDVTVHVKNTGGPGSYFLTFYAVSSVANGSPRNLGSSTPIQVTATYDEAVTYQIPLAEAYLGDTVDWVKVNNQPPNTAVATVTQCYLITTALGKCL